MTLITVTPKRLSRLAIIFAAIATVISLGIATAARAEDAAKALTKADVEAIVHDYLMANGKVIMDAVDTYQQEAVQQRSAEGIKNNHDKLFKDTDAPFLGNKDGDVIMVEFFDYNCGYCKKALPEVQKLAEKDKNLKIVFFEFPILGPTSKTAAQWALAAHRQGKYFEFHKRMMEHTGAIDDAALRDAAKAAGLDVDKAAKDAESSEISLHLDKNISLGRDVGVSGTPSFIIGDQFFPGAISADQMEKTVAAQREKKKD